MTIWRPIMLCSMATAGLSVAFAQADPRGPSNAPELITVDAASVVQGTVLFRPGQLFIGREDLPDQPGVQLLAKPRHTSMPDASDEFDRLDEACAPDEPERKLRIHADLEGDGLLEEIRVGRDHVRAPVQVKVYRDQNLIAKSTLPLPATPCIASVAEVNEDDRPELVLVWVSSESEHEVIGVHVFQLPQRPSFNADITD